MKPFNPLDDATASISANTTSVRAAIARQPMGAHQLRLHNAGASTVFWAAGDAAVSAAVTDIPLPAGAIEVVTVTNPGAQGATHIAAITASGTASLYLTTGQGF
jgi:hypothetical protein